MSADRWASSHTGKKSEKTFLSRSESHQKPASLPAKYQSADRFNRGTTLKGIELKGIAIALPTIAIGLPFGLTCKVPCLSYPKIL